MTLPAPAGGVAELARLGSPGNPTSLVPPGTRLHRHLRNCSEVLPDIGEYDGPYASQPRALRTAPPACAVTDYRGLSESRVPASKCPGGAIWPRRHWLSAPCGLQASWPPQKALCSGLNPFTGLFKRYAFGLNRNNPDTCVRCNRSFNPDTMCFGAAPWSRSGRRSALEQWIVYPMRQALCACIHVYTSEIKGARRL